MTEQEMNRHFQAIRTFIEHSMEMHANPRHTVATATVLTRLDKLETKMLDMVAHVTQQRATPSVTTKAA
jgi:hypothetical protein